MLVGSLKNQNLLRHKGQAVIDLLISFLIILLTLNFFYLFMFFYLNFTYLKANNQRYFSLVLQASEDIFFSSSATKDNFVKLGLLDENKIVQSFGQYKNFENIFYSFYPPTISNLDADNQLCIKRSLYSQLENNKKNFWVCAKW